MKNSKRKLLERVNRKQVNFDDLNEELTRQVKQRNIKMDRQPKSISNTDSV